MRWNQLTFMATSSPQHARSAARVARAGRKDKTETQTRRVLGWRGRFWVQETPMADLVIRGGLVCDGSGREAEVGDVAMTDGRITAVGAVSERGDSELDADGLVVAPGFIDLHTHYDCQVSWDPSPTPSSWHGVTTVVMGNCGFTIAPCRPAHREPLMRMLLYVEGMPIEALRAGIDWQWENFPDYLATLERRASALNVPSSSATQRSATGHGRGGHRAHRHRRGARGMQDIVRDAMRAGAFGWSTSLSPTHFFSATARRRRAAAPTATRSSRWLGAARVRPRHHRGRAADVIGSIDDKLDDQEFFAELARTSGRTVTWAPLLENPFCPTSERASRRRGDAPAHRRHGGAAGRLPAVRAALRLRHAGVRARQQRLLEADHGEATRRAPPALRRRRVPRRAGGDPGPVRRRAGPGLGSPGPAAARSERTTRWLDRSVVEIAAERGTSPVDAFCDPVLDDDLEGQWGTLMLNFDEPAVAAMMRHPAGVLALSDAGAHIDTLCDQGFTTYLLGHWVRERGALALEEAVRLITAVPAARYGLAGRGRLAPGCAADVVCFDPRRIGTRPTTMVYDLPQRQRRLLQGADGVEHVYVNGAAVVERGVPAGRRPGRVLRGGL